MHALIGRYLTTPVAVGDGRFVELLTDQYGRLIGGAGEAHIGEVDSKALRVQDVFTRPTNTTPYGAGDVISATVNDTATTVLRGITVARKVGKPCWLTYLEVSTNLTTFLTKLRLHFYTVAAPTTALVGDNVPFVRAYANVAQHIGAIDLPILTLVRAGDDFVRTFATLNTVDGQLPFLLTPDAADAKVYYRIEIVEQTPTPSSGQSFTLTAHITDA